MKTIRPHVWAAVFVALGAIGLCVFYPAQTKRVDNVPSQVLSTEQNQQTPVKAPPAEPSKVFVVADPKADERAILLAQLGFGTAGGHKVSVVFTNSIAKTVTTQ